jgi:uncharacterized protein
MRINAAELDVGQVWRATFNEVIDSRTSDVQFDAPVTGEVEVRRTPRTLELQGRLVTTAPLGCGRCLTAYRQRLTVELDQQFVMGDGPVASRGLRADDLVVALDPDLILDVTEAIRQDLLLALPMVPVCRPDCRGLCPRCGTNLNDQECGCRRDDIDPRLGGLLELNLPSNAGAGDRQRERGLSRGSQED